MLTIVSAVLTAFWDSPNTSSDHFDNFSFTFFPFPFLFFFFLTCSDNYYQTPLIGPETCVVLAEDSPLTEHTACTCEFIVLFCVFILLPKCYSNGFDYVDNFLLGVFVISNFRSETILHVPKK